MAEKGQNNRNRRNQNGKQPGKKRPPNKDKFEWKKATRTLTFWILVILGSIIIFQLFSGRSQQEEIVSYTNFVQLVKNGEVESGEISDKVFHGTYIADRGKFKTVIPYIDQSMLEMWDEHGIAYEFKEKNPSFFGYLITSILPWVILIGIWIFLMRRMQGGGPKGIFSFGKSRAKLLTENRPKITFKDVAGIDEAKDEVQEIIEFLKDPKKFQKLGGRIPRGALLLGPPGTGKTLLAKAIAGEAGVPFFSMSGADFVEMFVGVGASRVRDLFEQGKKNAPCIIFIDEIDAVGRQRGAGLGGGHDEREQTLNQLLVEMDGFDSNEGVILIAATNRPDVLDPALLRPGRFDRQIVVDRPDVRGRVGIMKVHTKKIPLGNDVNLDTIAKGTPGLSGADLESIVNEAALNAAKRNAQSVQMQDFEVAKDKVMMGMERKSLIISDKEKKNTAYHEAGHVLVAKLTPGADPVHKVTIIPRGRALGLTHLLPIDEKHNYSKSYLEALLTHLLGGRAAEKIVLNDFTTGAGNDIEKATALSRKMVCEWGMSDKLGPITFGKKEEEIFLGREIAKHRDYSESTAIEIDAEVRRIIEQAEKRAEDIVRKNIDKLHALANALLEREILDKHDIDRILQGKKLRPVKRTQGHRKRTSAKTQTPSTASQKPDTAKTSPTESKRPQQRHHHRKKTFDAQKTHIQNVKQTSQAIKPDKADQKRTESAAKPPDEKKTELGHKISPLKKPEFKFNIEENKPQASHSKTDKKIPEHEPKTPSHVRRAAGKMRAQARTDNDNTDDKQKPRQDNTKPK